MQEKAILQLRNQNYTGQGRMSYHSDPDDGEDNDADDDGDGNKCDGEANAITGYSKMPQRLPRNLLKPPNMYTQTQYHSYYNCCVF